MTVLQRRRPVVLTATSFLVPWGGLRPALRFAPSGQAQQLLSYLRGDRALPQLIRFALVGGTSNIAYVLLFLTMHSSGPLVANIVGSIISTMIANELHRQLTFHASGRVGWFTAQWEGGGLALLGLGISTAALATLAVIAPGIGDTAQAASVLAISAVVGGLRFLALRGWVF